MSNAGGRQTLRLAVAAAIAGFAWGTLRHRSHPRRTFLAIMQAAEWFIACGGAATLVEVLREGLEGDDTELTERVTHSMQTVTDRAARGAAR